MIITVKESDTPEIEVEVGQIYQSYGNNLYILAVVDDNVYPKQTALIRLDGKRVLHEADRWYITEGKIKADIQSGNLKLVNATELTVKVN